MQFTRFKKPIQALLVAGLFTVVVITPSRVSADDSTEETTATVVANTEPVVTVIQEIPTTVPKQVVKPKVVKKPNRAQLELFYQMMNDKTPPIAYWDAVAQCETKGNWKNGGNWAGGLGIYQRTWYEFGGYDYAKRPQDATRTQQIVIANRIAVHGYQWKNRFLTWEDKVAKKGMYKYPVRYFGWGCAAQTVGNPCGKLKNNNLGKYRPPKAWRAKNCS